MATQTTQPVLDQPSQSPHLDPSDTPFPFLKSPQELRDKVYRFVLVSESALNPTKHPRYEEIPVPVDTQVSWLGNSGKANALPDTYQAEKLLTHLSNLPRQHQIYAEALDIFLKHNEFKYQEDWVREQPGPNMWNEDGFNPTPRYKQNRTILCESTLRQAPKVRAEFWSNDLFAEFAQLMAQNSNLTSLHVSFEHLSDTLVKKLE